MQPTLGRLVPLPPSLIDELHVVMTEIMCNIDAAAHVSLAVASHGGSWNAYVTDQVAAELNEVEVSSGGPALDALWSGRVARIGSTLSHVQWPEYVQACMHHGVGSVVAFPISIDRRRVGVVTIASNDHYAFGPEAASVGLSAARRAANILNSRVAGPALAAGWHNSAGATTRV